MNDRDTVLRKVREALEPLPERAAYPAWEDALTVCREHPEFDNLWELFEYKSSQVKGTALDGLDALGAWMRKKPFKRGYCDPAWLERIQNNPAFSGIQFSGVFDCAQFDSYEFGITQASGAIAETGSLILKDSETASRLGALAPWTHIALLPAGKMYANCSEALLNCGDDPAIVWATGPSKTADIEGILIEGVHGPGEQVCCRV